MQYLRQKLQILFCLFNYVMYIYSSSCSGSFSCMSSSFDVQLITAHALPPILVHSELLCG